MARILSMPDVLRPKLGVLRLDGWGKDYLPMAGDIDDERSWANPIIHTTAENVTFELLCDPVKFLESKETIRDGVTVAVQQLIENGANSIIANCGLFMWLHATGIIEAAVDTAMDNLEHKYRRPTVTLSSLCMLPAYLPTLGLGEQQRVLSEEPSIKCRVVVFTSNGASCMELLKKVPQLTSALRKASGDGKTLAGLYTCGLYTPTVINPSSTDLGEVLVVGLDAGYSYDDEGKRYLNGDKVIGLDGPLLGFEAVKEGTTVVGSRVQPGIEKVAKAVKAKYPDIALAVVECTQVSAFSDTIGRAMGVDVLDPIKVGTSALEMSTDHAFAQDTTSARLAAVVKLHLGRCENNLEEVLEDEVAQQKALEEKDDLEALQKKINKEFAELKELNEKQLDDIRAQIRGAEDMDVQNGHKANLADMIKSHQKNYAGIWLQHEKNFARMREMRGNNEVLKLIVQHRKDYLLRKAGGAAVGARA